MCRQISENFNQLLWQKNVWKILAFIFDSVNITCEEGVRLLGADIDFNLSFDYHISNICKKAAQQLNVTRKIGHNLSLLNWLTIIHTFVLSNFNFVLYHGTFAQKITLKRWEKLQETHPGNGQLVRRRCTIENQFDLFRRTSWHV